MLVTIPVCAKDLPLALANLELCLKQHPAPVSHTALISHPRGLDIASLTTLASRYFSHTTTHAYDDWRGDAAWPHPQNWSFQQTVRHLQASCNPHYWLWWEADAIPLHPDWLDLLDTAYIKAAKPFAGAITTQGKHTYMAGVGIYPADTSPYFRHTMLCRGAAFDIVSSTMDGTLRHTADLSHLIAHYITPTHFTSDDEVSALINSGAVLYHKCKDGSLTTILNRVLVSSWRKKLKSWVDSGRTYFNGESGFTKPAAVTTNNVAYHSGDLGDIIYSLPTFKALGGGTLYLGPDNRSGMCTREIMTQARASLILPLLKSQPYITSVAFRATLPANLTYDLNDFRLEMRDGKCIDLQPGYNLARVPLKHWGLPFTLDSEPWLEAAPLPIAPVVISRSVRYHNPDFDWKRILKTYSNRFVFVGGISEHAIFEQEFGKVPYHHTPTLLDLARVIAGASLFVGNQSCPLAIAIGLGKQVVVEDCPTASNCIFDRPGYIYGCSPATRLPLLQARPITISLPMENYTGFGQLSNAIAVGLHDNHIPFRITPWCFTEKLNKNAPQATAAITQDACVPDLLVCPVTEITRLLQSNTLLLTMWESSTLPTDAVKAINDRACALIVPTKWNRDCFQASGVTRPIHLAPLGIDPSVYHLIQPAPQPRPFRFGTGGRLAHGFSRKGISEAITAFQRAFPADKSVELHIKIFEDCHLDAPSDPRITIHRRFMPGTDLAAWYASLDCFVSLTKGEGWGLLMHQALAVGRPVIAPWHGAQCDFLSHANSYPVSFKLATPDVPAYKSFGQWCIPDVNHCVELMRHVRTHPAETASRGCAAAASVAHLTWSNTTTHIIRALYQVGKL